MHFLNNMYNINKIIKYVEKSIKKNLNIYGRNFQISRSLGIKIIENGLCYLLKLIKLNYLWT